MPEEVTKLVKKKLSGKAKFRLGMVLSLFVMALATVYLYFQLNKSQVAQLQSGSPASSSSSYEINLTPVRKTGKYISFDYPSGMLTDPTQIYGQIVEEFKFYAADTESWVLGIDVQTSRFGKLTDSTAYAYRANNPTLYAQSYRSINRQSFDIMTDKNATGFSQVAFILQNNLVVSVSLTGDDTRGIVPLQTTFSMVLGSLHFIR